MPHSLSQPRASNTPGDDAPDLLDTLVARARTGDRAAFTLLFERYNARICAYLARLVGDDDLGHDLAQETFLAVWRALPQLRDELRFEPWLYRIATNAARSHLRRGRTLQWLPWQDAESSEALATPGPEEHIGNSEAVSLALKHLSPQCRTCLLLQIEGGFSQREIADLLSISEKSVSAYVSRAREQFREVYRRLSGERQHCADQPHTQQPGGTAR
ncbi:MAG: RNA polymerase ECF-type sigma factor [Ktedonobacterales bacterium]|nr:MAG: RNA polymerase ECF-type sigma factor [Ktedonobacterales bacterium]